MDLPLGNISLFNTSYSMDIRPETTKSLDTPSKVRLGEHIANKLGKSANLGNSEPKKLIITILDKVTQQMNLE
jgi:hypothetical protein